MRYGLMMPFQSPPCWARPYPALYREFIEQTVLAEELGYDTIWLTEHHFDVDGWSPSLLPLAVGIATRTNRIRIGTFILILPFQHALRVAEGNLYSVAHYYEQNGDLMRDPDIVFLKDSEANYYPVSYQQDGLGIYQEAVIFEADTIKGVRSKTQRDIASFCTLWMNNIREQQLRGRTG